MSSSEAIFLDATIERTPAQAERLRRVTDIPRVARQCLAKEKVGAESSLGALHFQVCVGRREHTGIYALGFRRANTLHLAGFEHPQEFGLLFDRYIGDFVEKDRAFICQLKASDAIAASVGERALHVSKQFALECAFG